MASTVAESLSLDRVLNFRFTHARDGEFSVLMGWDGWDLKH